MRVVVILNGLLRRVRRGERFEKLSARDMLMVKFVGVSGPDIWDEIRRVQQKFNAPKAASDVGDDVETEDLSVAHGSALE